MRLIDADETLNKLAEWQAAAYADGDVFHNGISQGLFDAITIITQAATIDPVKHGKWIYDGDCIICSKCRKAFGFISTEWATNFCPDCGADMRGKVNEP